MEKKLTDEEIVNVIAEQKAEIERLTEERKTANKHDVMYWFNAYKECVADYEEYGIKNAELQKQVDELKEELDKAYETERANIQAEIAEAGTSCHWCKQQAVKDTAKEICDLILEHWEKKQFVECDWLRVAISEKYGVEVE